MASELKPSSLDFGVVIAFVAPGFVAFNALAYHARTARAWMAAAAEKDQNVGVFLFVLLGSLSLGLAVSGVRALLVDRLLVSKWLGQYAVPRLNLDWSRVNEDNLAVLVTIRDSHYRHYQFYSNTLVALVGLALARLFVPGSGLSWGAMVAAGLLGLLLLFSAREALERYVKGVHALLPPR